MQEDNISVPEEESQSLAARRKRVNRLKKMIITTLVVSIMIPYVAFVVLFLQYIRTRSQLDRANIKLEQLQKSTYEMEELIQKEKQQLQNEIKKLYSEFENLKEEEDVQQPEAKHKVYLTFDDGPSANTDEILDILDRYQVKATFFVVGKEDETSQARMKRIVDEGHTLGTHSYSHVYSEIYESVESFSQDVDSIRSVVENISGTTAFAYRFPGGSSNKVSNVDISELVQVLQDKDLTYYDWNISSGDAVSNVPDVETLVENSTKDIQRWENSVILLHDANDKHATVEALPLIIEKILSMEDTQILPITMQTEPVQHAHPE